MNNNFTKHKQDFLSKQDKSKKGGIDNKIQPLVDLINSNENYYTTSSCSGRIVLLNLGERKNECEWLFVSHDKVDENSNLLGNIDLNKSNKTFFRMEGAILHVCCKDLDSAKKLFDLGKSAGFKVGGIISIKPKIVVELRSVDFLDTIISKHGKMLVGADYVKILINIANSKLERTWERIKKLSTELVE